jgi:hypothetical protein
MSRLPFLNFCLMIFLITLLAVQHSIAVFHPKRAVYESIGYMPEPRYHGAHLLEGRIGSLADFWQRSMILSEWLLEYQTIRWSDQAPSSPKFDLAQARFHVANAEVFDVAMDEAQRARLELERAENYLRESETLIRGALRPTLESIRQELMAAEADAKAKSLHNAERYEKIKTELDQISAKL